MLALSQILEKIDMIVYPAIPYLLQKGSDAMYQEACKKFGEDVYKLAKSIWERIFSTDYNSSQVDTAKELNYILGIADDLLVNSPDENIRQAFKYSLTRLLNKDEILQQDLAKIFDEQLQIISTSDNSGINIVSSTIYAVGSNFSGRDVIIKGKN